MAQQEHNAPSDIWQIEPLDSFFNKGPRIGQITIFHTIACTQVEHRDEDSAISKVLGMLPHHQENTEGFKGRYGIVLWHNISV